MYYQSRRGRDNTSISIPPLSSNSKARLALQTEALVGHGHDSARSQNGQPFANHPVNRRTAVAACAWRCFFCVPILSLSWSAQTRPLSCWPSALAEASPCCHRNGSLQAMRRRAKSLYPPPRALSLTSLCYALLLPSLLSSVILTLLHASVAQPLLSAVSLVLNRIVCFYFCSFVLSRFITALASRAFSYTLVSDAQLRRPVSCFSCIYSI